jgi:hypothetical protein
MSAKTSKQKSLPHEGKKLPFGVFSFRVSVSNDREELLQKAFSTLHSHLRDSGRGFHKIGNSVAVEFRCQGAGRKVKIVEHFVAQLQDCLVEYSINGKFEK